MRHRILAAIATLCGLDWLATQIGDRTRQQLDWLLSNGEQPDGKVLVELFSSKIIAGVAQNSLIAEELRQQLPLLTERERAVETNLNELIPRQEQCKEALAEVTEEWKASSTEWNTSHKAILSEDSSRLASEITGLKDELFDISRRREKIKRLLGKENE